MKTCEVSIEVPFHDVDAMGIVWHGHYTKYLEIARCALLDAIDYNYLQMKASGYSWPVVDLHVRFVKSATFRQKIVVVATLVEWENRLKITYLIKDEEGRRLATGSTTQVAVHIEAGELCFESPAIVFQKLGLPVP
jgi:acyl-CoA thioester hydrolase